MPVKNSTIKQQTLAAHKQLSYENLVTAWLMGDGWEVLIPAIDHGKKTDLVVADDTNYYRIQVKTIESNDESIKVENKWKGGKNRLCNLFFSNRGMGLHCTSIQRK